MVKRRFYTGENGVDKVWFESSNILYSECDDKKDSLKTLRITFKNGTTYEYYDVDVNDYLLFISGGLDGSNGKAFFKYIKNKYEFNRLEDKSVKDILAELENLEVEK